MGTEPAWSRDHDDAIAATALSRTRRDGPDVFQRLKIQKETTHGIVRRPRVV